MFVHNIDPVLFSLGPLEIRYYGLAYAIGFLLVYWMVNRYRKSLELTKDQVESLVVYVIFGVILGSRLGHVLLWNPSFYLANPLEILAIWRGGMAFHGGFIGAIIGVWLFSRKNKTNFAKLADVIAIPGIFALALGRIANFINGELWGPVTSVSWCVEFPGAEGCRHPYQIYAFFKRLVVVGVLYWIWTTKKFKDGFVFWMTVLLMGIGRTFLDTFREDVIHYGLKLGQWYSLGMFLVALCVLIKYYRSDLKGLLSS